VVVKLRCEIFPSDLDRTLRFYVDVLGFDVAHDGRQKDPPYLTMRRGEVHLGAASRPAIAEPEARRPPVGVELVLEVHDLDAEHARILATGWPITEELTRQPWGLRDFRLRDPDGYYWRITELKTPQDPT
jgi:catechol 2,3-dioxygenase-like lactoylglutathione lyase family enzyme